MYKNCSKAIQDAVSLSVSDKNGSERRKRIKQNCYFSCTTTKSKD